MISTIQFNLRAILTVNSKCDLPSLILDPRTDIQVIFERLGSVLNVQHGRIRGEKKGRSRKLKEVGRHKSRRGAFMPVERLRFAMWHSTFVSYINFRRPAAELHHPNPDLKPTCNRTNVIFHVSKAIHPIYYFHSSFIFFFSFSLFPPEIHNCDNLSQFREQHPRFASLPLKRHFISTTAAPDYRRLNNNVMFQG